MTTWTVVTEQTETWVEVAGPGLTVFDPYVFDPAPIFDTGGSTGRWSVVAKDAEVWTVA